MSEDHNPAESNTVKTAEKSVKGPAERFNAKQCIESIDAQLDAMELVLDAQIKKLELLTEKQNEMIKMLNQTSSALGLPKSIIPDLVA